MGILEDRTNKVLEESKTYLHIELPVSKFVKLAERSSIPKEPQPTIPNPNDYIRQDAFSFIYKDGKLFIDSGTESHIKIASKNKIGYSRYKNPSGRGLCDKSVLSVWFSYDDIFEEPFSKAVFALKSNDFIDEDTKIKFYDTHQTDEYTSVKAFIKDYYKQEDKLKLFPKQLKLGRFDRG